MHTQAVALRRELLSKRTRAAHAPGRKPYTRANPRRESNYGDGTRVTVSKIPPSTILEDAARWVDIIAQPAPRYVAGAYQRRQDETVARLTAFLKDDKP